MGQSAWIGQTTLRSVFNQKQCSFCFFGGYLDRSIADIKATSVDYKFLDPMDPYLGNMFESEILYLSHQAQFLAVQSTCHLTDKNEKYLHYD